MTTIKLKVNGASATAVLDGILTSGMVGVDVKITYDDTWGNLNKTAVFRVGSFSRGRENIGTVTTVPWEVLRHSGKVLEIGVVGTDETGNVVIPTVWASVGTIRSGTQASVPGAPNPDAGDIGGGAGAPIDDSTIADDKTWSSLHILETLCPSFEESGSIVACQPVAGYPLTVQAQEGTTVTRCGKNLWDLKSGVSQVEYTSSGGTVATRWGYRISLPAGTYTLHAEQAGEQSGGFLYGSVNGSDGSYLASASVVSTELLTKVITLNEGDVIYLYNGAANGTEAKSNTLFSIYNVQIELGDTATAYEEYQGEAFTPEAAVPALSGVNTLWADTGSITVSGRADPVVISEKLTNAIIAMGGNI